MSIRKFDKAALNAWVGAIIAKENVYGVQAKGDRFAYDKLTNAEDLRLDYDVTILPPKKYFQPPRENLLEFNIHGEYKSVLETSPFVLFGVHPYDVAAISQMDFIFSADNYDVHYMNRRHNATIVACDVQKVSSNIFAGYLGTATVKEGFDVLLTLLDDYYLAEAISTKGEALLALLINSIEAEPADITKREQLWKDNIKLLRKQKLKPNPHEIPDLLDKSYYDPIWDEKAKLCFSCGSCNLVCPTCYCFDVQDEINWDLETGKRTRAWDGCLLRDFATVAGGNNFRRQRADRYRHRYYRKGKYIAEKLSKLACVGCGRCITACVPNIANPVEVFNRLYMHNKNIYIPEQATLVSKYAETTHDFMYEFRLESGFDFNFEPGQFVEVSIPGIGEAPITICSSPTQLGVFQLLIRKIGNVTTALTKLNPGSKVGIRGPFGNGFPVDDVMKGKDVLFVCGGIGIASVRSAINYIFDKRSNYGNVTILYSAKNPEEQLFKEDIALWKTLSGVTVLETVDTGNEDWLEHTGSVAVLLPSINVNPKNTITIVAGPPATYKFVLEELHKIHIQDNLTYISLERRMKCGVGKCGHCQINNIYVCQDGPIFKYVDIKEVMEAI